MQEVFSPATRRTMIKLSGLGKRLGVLFGVAFLSYAVIFGYAYILDTRGFSEGTKDFIFYCSLTFGVTLSYIYFIIKERWHAIILHITVAILWYLIHIVALIVLEQRGLLNYKTLFGHFVSSAEIGIIYAVILALMIFNIELKIEKKRSLRRK